MNFGSLFAGIGGIDLGLERAGMKCKWQVEIEEFRQRVLARRWPHVKRYGDVKECGKHNLERVNLIAFGFPCQDISYASPTGAGINGARSGLWTHGARIIGELRPDYALVENVPALLERGMGRVLGDLAALGYDAEWDCLSAKDFGAPHLRERIFIVAYANKMRELQPQGREQDKRRRLDHGTEEGAINSDHRQERVQRIFKGEVSRVAEFSWCKDVRRVEDLRGRSDIPEPLFRGSRDGVPDWMDRIAAVGDSVVPQAAEWIGRQIMNAVKCEVCGGKAEKNCKYGEGETAALDFPLCSTCYVDHLELAHGSNTNAQEEVKELRRATES